jgi:hypothetical protein
VRTGSLDANASGSPTTTTLATTNTPGNNQFIISTLGLNDWRNPKNDELWQGVDGANNPCPTGWRLPTQAEWEAEAISNLSDGFTKLKLTRSGRRAADTGDFFQSTSAGNYWTSTANVSPAGYSMFMYLGAGISFVDYDLRADGKAVRCIK